MSKIIIYTPIIFPSSNCQIFVNSTLFLYIVLKEFLNFLGLHLVKTSKKQEIASLLYDNEMTARWSHRFHYSSSLTKFTTIQIIRN